MSNRVIFKLWIYHLSFRYKTLIDRTLWDGWRKERKELVGATAASVTVLILFHDIYGTLDVFRLCFFVNIWSNSLLYNCSVLQLYSCLFRSRWLSPNLFNNLSALLTFDFVIGFERMEFEYFVVFEFCFKFSEWNRLCFFGNIWSNSLLNNCSALLFYPCLFRSRWMSPNLFNNLSALFFRSLEYISNIVVGAQDLVIWFICHIVSLFTHLNFKCQLPCDPKMSFSQKFLSVETVGHKRFYD